MLTVTLLYILQHFTLSFLCQTIVIVLLSSYLFCSKSVARGVFLGFTGGTVILPLYQSLCDNYINGMQQPMFDNRIFMLMHLPSGQQEL